MRLAALAAVTIFQRETPAMSFRNLAAQHKPYACARRLGSKEGHEEIRGIGKPVAFVFYPDIQVRTVSPPANHHVALGFQRRIDGIPEQVNQQLIELVA